jgi:hypothetical protein
VIAASTRRLTRGLFEYRDLGTVSVKGFGDPVQVWQVTGASTVESRFEALRTATTPLVGREEEIELLLRRWGQTKGGRAAGRPSRLRRRRWPDRTIRPMAIFHDRNGLQHRL